MQATHADAELAVGYLIDELVVEAYAMGAPRRALEVEVLLNAGRYDAVQTVGFGDAGLGQMLGTIDQRALHILLERTVEFAAAFTSHRVSRIKLYEAIDKGYGACQVALVDGGTLGENSLRHACKQAAQE